jgi:hypothetical protein
MVALGRKAAATKRIAAAAGNWHNAPPDHHRSSDLSGGL